MIPVSIKMKNFLSYEDEEFDFSNITNATVVGENGAGKSSFCTDSITWALYGIGSKGGANDSANYVTTGADSCTVEFVFELNKNLYKVIRSYSVKKSKNSVTLFTINADGDEIPISIGKTRDTQKYIETLLKMTYKTFTASSMICQNKSNEFTEGMTDMERKEALISILDVDEWDKIKKMADEDVSRLKGEIELAENDVNRLDEVVSHEQENIDKKKVFQDDLKKVEIEKGKQNKIIEDNQQKIFQMNSINEEIQKEDSFINDLNIRLSNNQTEVTRRQNNINLNTKKIDEYQSKIESAQKLLDNKEKIEKAYDDEIQLTNQINVLNQTKMALLEKHNELSNVTQNGKDWNNNKAMRQSVVDVKITEAEKQAQALAQVPCSATVEFNSSCPFLRMANEAKNQLQGLYVEKQAIDNEVNPFREEYVKVNNEYKILLAQFNEKDLTDAQNALIEAKKYSVYKPQLDNAVNSINEWMEMIANIKAQIGNDRNEINNINTQNTNYRNDITTHTEKLNTLKQDVNRFSEINRIYTMAKDELSRLENQEKDLNAQITVCDTLLSQIEEAKVNSATAKKTVLDKRGELRTAIFMQEACGKKSGVPSLIVENAIPELESTANKILENMLEGRLQIRLNTQEETKTTKNMKEVLSITVLDNGFERHYETYSGAEKFVVDLAIRIAMSKFLAHRAGASVQLFVLDEGLSCADTKNREEIIKAIRSISNEFSKVLFITHIEELKDSLDQKIIVTRNSEGSHIRVE